MQPLGGLISISPSPSVSAPNQMNGGGMPPSSISFMLRIGVDRTFQIRGNPEVWMPHSFRRFYFFLLTAVQALREGELSNLERAFQRTTSSPSPSHAAIAFTRLPPVQMNAYPLVGSSIVHGPPPKPSEPFCHIRWLHSGGGGRSAPTLTRPNKHPHPA